MCRFYQYVWLYLSQMFANDILGEEIYAYEYRSEPESESTVVVALVTVNTT